MPRVLPAASVDGSDAQSNSSKRGRDSDDDSSSCCSSNRRSLFTNGVKTINASLKYKCDCMESARSRLRELIDIFSNNLIERLQIQYVKASFVIDPSNCDLYVLLHLRRSIPETHWGKIAMRTHAAEFIMKDPNPWLKFYPFMVERLPFSSVAEMVDNEEIVKQMVTGGLAPTTPGAQSYYRGSPMPGDVYADSFQSSRCGSSMGGSSSRASSVFSHTPSRPAPFSDYGDSMDGSSSRASLVFSPAPPHPAPYSENGLLDQDSAAPALVDPAPYSENGLLDQDSAAPALMDPAPSQAPDPVMPRGDLELCRHFLSSASAPPAAHLDDIVGVVRNYFSTLPEGRGKFAEALLELTQWDILADALHLEYCVLSAVSAYCTLPIVHSIALLDLSALSSRIHIPDEISAAVGNLMAQREDAFTFQLQLVDRTSLLFLLVVHMFHEKITNDSTRSPPPLLHYLKSLMQETHKLAQWRASLAFFARWVQSMGMDDARHIEQCVSRQVRIPYQRGASSMSSVPVEHQKMKILSKVKCVGQRLGIAIEKSLAHQIFMNMQDYTKSVVSLTVDSPGFYMLPAPSFSHNPSAHNEDALALLDSFMYPASSSASAALSF